MTTQTETTHAGGFIISEANGNRSRQNVTLTSGQDLEDGAVLGKVTSGGKYVEYDNNASDGSQAAAGILIGKGDATAGDLAVAIINCDAEVNGEELLWSDSSPDTHEAAGVVDLLALGIKVR